MDYNISLEVVNSYFEGDKIYHKNSIIKIKKLDQKVKMNIIY
ncbi:hypothetical protein NWP96_03280 [Mycoplasmopsis cynos]|nr:hypothetical protein [Mycoplasmopsis cynos]